MELELSGILGGALSGCTVAVCYADRWKRDQVTVVWDGFRGLLPEERFRLVMRAMTEGVFKARFARCVWFELAPGETESDLMAMPRSEDIADRAAVIAASLTTSGFFAGLEERMQPDPAKACGGDLKITRELLRKLLRTDQAVTDACLLMIRHHAYCDCQVLLSARPLIEAETHGPPTKRGQRKRGKPARSAPG